MQEQPSAVGARLVVRASYPPLAFLYGLCTPTITINDQPQSRPWGVHPFDVPPGNYEVSVSYPWIFMPECGKNTVRLTLQQGETKTVSYTASYIRYLPGSISVS
jgi:hypothetical protein